MSETWKKFKLNKQARERTLFGQSPSDSSAYVSKPYASPRDLRSSFVESFFPFFEGDRVKLKPSDKIMSRYGGKRGVKQLELLSFLLTYLLIVLFPFLVGGHLFLSGAW